MHASSPCDNGDGGNILEKGGRHFPSPTQPLNNTIEDAIMEDDYGSDWNDIDDQDLIAAVDKAEQIASSSSKHSQEQGRWGGHDPIFLEDDFDDLGDDEIQSVAIPKLLPFTFAEAPRREAQDKVYYPSLVESMSNLASKGITAQKDEKDGNEHMDCQQDEGGSSKKQRRSRTKAKGPVL